MAKRVYKANSGVDDPSLLAEDFRFEFPVVSLAKKVCWYQKPIHQPRDSVLYYMVCQTVCDMPCCQNS